MDFRELAVSDSLLIEPRPLTDNLGSFFEALKQSAFIEAAGRPFQVVQVTTRFPGAVSSAACTASCFRRAKRKSSAACAARCSTSWSTSRSAPPRSAVTTLNTL
jgi:hypothetical protein